MTAATDTALTEAFDTIRTLTDQLATLQAENTRLRESEDAARAEGYQQGLNAGRYLR